jgi:hypothetical protein
LCWVFAAEDNLAFILGWYVKFPEYKKNEFYLTGESFAGNVKTIPFHLCITYYYYYFILLCGFFFKFSLGFSYNCWSLLFLFLFSSLGNFGWRISWWVRPGHYLPELAQQIVLYNEKPGDFKINFKGFAV